MLKISGRILSVKNRVVLIIIVLLLLAAGLLYSALKTPRTLPSLKESVETSADSEVNVIASGLDTPWGIAFLPNEDLLVTERPGRVRLVSQQPGSPTRIVGELSAVREIGEGGLLGIALHPDFSLNDQVYLYYTYSESGGQTLNRVVRMKYQQERLVEEEVILDKIPGSSNHNGGRIKFGPDRWLYITTGDAGNPSQAQDINSLAGKILRVTDNGTMAPGNPFNNEVWSYGHRNPQGLAWDQQGQLWATEHGRSGATSGLDELNLIERGRNYGWPVIQGDATQTGMEAPWINSGGTTWAPAGLAYWRGKAWFAGLRGQAIYQADIAESNIPVKPYFQKEYGRIREVVAGPMGSLYFTTSNHDGRGNPAKDDDRIVKINRLL